MKHEITFILPTLNRKRWIKRAIESCLACVSDDIEAKVIIIDGQSDDGSFEELQATYQGNPRVSLLQNKRTDGFMQTCYLGVSLVRTRYVTFMYDDDILSPYFYLMFEKMLQAKREFIASYGQTYPVDKVYDFKPSSRVDFYPPEKVIMDYSGSNELVQGRLPVSPICCIVSKNLLNEWVPFVQHFGGQTKLRRYFMLHKNIGPDLLIYLLALLQEKEPVPVVLGKIAQFSSHANSMTIKATSFDIEVGYWLARIAAFNKLCKERPQLSCLSQYSAYLILFGFYLVAINWTHLDFKWTGAILVEIASVLKFTRGIRQTTASLQAACGLLIRKFKKTDRRPLEIFS